jgi:hypothetical protein
MGIASVITSCETSALLAPSWSLVLSEIITFAPFEPHHFEHRDEIGEISLGC